MIALFHSLLVCKLTSQFVHSYWYHLLPYTSNIRLRVVCSRENISVDRWYIAVLFLEIKSIVACLQKQNCTMPEDLKNFYLTMNGFSARWSVRMNGALNSKSLWCSVNVIVHCSSKSWFIEWNKTDFICYLFKPIFITNSRDWNQTNCWKFVSVLFDQSCNFIISLLQVHFSLVSLYWSRHSFL